MTEEQIRTMIEHHISLIDEVRKAYKNYEFVCYPEETTREEDIELVRISNKEGYSLMELRVGWFMPDANDKKGAWFHETRTMPLWYLWDHKAVETMMTERRLINLKREAAMDEARAERERNRAAEQESIDRQNYERLKKKYEGQS